MRRSSQSWEQPLSLRLRHSLMKQLSSSEPSAQSARPSHSSASGTQVPILHRKNESLHLLSWVPSSEPSPQSSAPSHTHSLEMQRWFLHSNCSHLPEIKDPLPPTSHDAPCCPNSRHCKGPPSPFHNALLHLPPPRRPPCPSHNAQRSSLQWVSSSPFSQSSSLSQVQDMGMQRPLGQAK
uniref:Uncharacterized protein n=1 Tax=Crocodylus porosus TaxID=8502 RepID=A0A7M4EYV1_CROPO